MDNNASVYTDINDALAQAQVLDDDWDGFDIEASRTRITLRLADGLWTNAMTWQGVAQAVGDLCPDAADLPPGRLTAMAAAERHEQAYQDLRRLSSLVVSSDEAASQVTRLTLRDLDDGPKGALVFACLLHLARHEQGAVFWWRFAAGAGDHTAAYCLYLHHLRRGEVRAATHWFRQADQLKPRTARTFPPTSHGDYLQPGIFIEYIDHPGQVTAPAAAHVEDLEVVVDQLPDARFDDLGTIPLPDADLLHDQLAAR